MRVKCPQSVQVWFPAHFTAMLVLCTDAVFIGDDQTYGNG